MFDLYKPFRNRLRHRSIWESLHTVYRFMQFLDFEVPLPRELAPPAMLSLRDRMRWGIVQWEFEILAREIILNGDKNSKSNLASWGDVAREINTIKHIENETWGIHSKEDGDVLYELVRIAHRQFPWQKGITQPHIANYSRLYENDGLADMVHASHGMSHAEMLQFAMALSGHFLESFTLRLPLRNEVNRVPQDVSNSFIDRFSSTLEEIRSSYQEYQSYDINWAYTFNPLRSKPLIRVNDRMAICPIPSFLLRRVTSEVYFDLVRDQVGFSRHFGPAVQELIGEIAVRADTLGRFRVIPEARYGAKGAPKDTVDWIIVDESGSLFVECKAARTRYRGISDLTDRRFIDAEFDRIRGFTVQLYKSLHSALGGEYPNWKPDGKPVYPIVVTLEDWQTFGIHVDRLVVDPLKTDLAAQGIDPAIVDRHPPAFCAIDTFEMAVNVCNIVGLANVFRQKAEGEYPQWALETFLINNFKSELAARPGSAFSDQWLKLMRRG